MKSRLDKSRNRSNDFSRSATQVATTNLFVIASLAIGVVVSACNASGSPSPPPTPPPTPAPPTPAEAGQIAAVDLIGAWVDGGASETKPFEFVGLDGRTYAATFADDIFPLFDRPNLWYDGAKECSNCHVYDLAGSDAELDLSSYEGIIAGSYRLSSPPGTPIIIPGNWQASPLRDRLMVNRMPIRGMADKAAADDAARDGPEVQASGGTVAAVNLIGAWVASGAAGATEPFQFTGVDGQTYSTTYAEGIEPLFAARDLWHHDTKSCVRCHDSDLANSDAELDMSSVEGILAGSYRLAQAPGVPIIVPGDWAGSLLRDRLRDNRMPVDTPPDAPPEGPVVEAGQLK